MRWMRRSHRTWQSCPLGTGTSARSRAILLAWCWICSDTSRRNRRKEGAQGLPSYNGRSFIVNIKEAKRLLINDLGRHNGPLLPEIQERLTTVLQSGWYILGAEVSAFEESFAAYCGVSHCVGVGNGTDALELALRALRIGSGDEVVTVANAGGYGTTAIRCAGADPVYVDVRPDSMSMDPAVLKTRITSRTRAIIATHLYGRMADMPALQAIADAAHIPVIEDSAQAHGATIDGRAAGAWGQ